MIDTKANYKQARETNEFKKTEMQQRRHIYSVPSIFGATVPRESLLNFNEVIPGGL